MIDRERLVTTFLDLVRIDSVSGEEQAAGDWAWRRLEMLGAAVTRDAIGNVLGRLSGRGEPLLLNAHLDTVVPGRGVRPVVEGDTIRSDGSTVLGGDDKAGVAVVLEAVQALQDAGVPVPALEILFTVQEEVGLRGAKAVDTATLHAREGIGLDAGGPIGTIVVRAPAQDSLDVTIVGRAAHAGGEPEKGISAIRVAAEAIARMPHGRIDPETTANIGIIEGGQATNIVCERVHIRGEARSRSADKLAAQIRAMVEAFEEAAARHGARAEISVQRAYEAYSIAPDDPLLRLLGDAAASVAVQPVHVPTGGGSDANVLNAAGLRVVNISCGMDRVHTTDERIAISDMVKAAEWLAAALRLRTGT